MAELLPSPPPSLLDGAALFLDFDGTLTELAAAPDAIHVSRRLPDLLKAAARQLDGRLAIVTGRAIADLERHLDCSGIAVSGSHGLELRLAGAPDVPLAAPAGLERALAEAGAFAASAPGVLLEAKPAGLALHYRQAPEREEEVRAFVSGLAVSTGLLLQPGKMVAELKPPGDKGAAVRALMAEAPFKGSRPLFIGDDLTDEHGFEAATSLGGDGILVGPVRATAARWRLAGVDAVADWLAQGVAA